MDDGRWAGRRQGSGTAASTLFKGRHAPMCACLPHTTVRHTQRNPSALTEGGVGPPLLLHDALERVVDELGLGHEAQEAGAGGRKLSGGRRRWMGG